MLQLEVHKRLGMELNSALQDASSRHRLLSEAYGKGSEQARLALHEADNLSMMRYPLSDVMLTEHGPKSFDQHVYFPDKR